MKNYEDPKLKIVEMDYSELIVTSGDPSGEIDDWGKGSNERRSAIWDDYDNN